MRRLPIELSQRQLRVTESGLFLGAHRKAAWARSASVDAKRKRDTVAHMDRESKPKKPRWVRWSFTEEFKVSAVRLVLDQGKSVSAAARDLDLPASALQG